MDEIHRLENYLKSELNVKEIEYTTNEDEFINLYTKPNSPVLGRRLGKDFKRYNNLIEALDTVAIKELQDSGEIKLGDETFSADDILVFREAREGTEALSDRFISIDVDCTFDDALMAEGLAREVVNRIQRSRRDAGFNVVDRIEINYEASSELAKAIEAHKQYIAGKTLAVSMQESVNDQELNFEIEGHQLSLTLRQVES